MATTTAPARALDLIEQAAEALNHASIGRDEDDPRLGLVSALHRNWDATDRRFDAARALIDHDYDVNADALLYEARGLLVTVVDKLEDAILSRGEQASDDSNAQREARELRDATERLHRIVDAVTAVHLLDD